MTEEAHMKIIKDKDGGYVGVGVEYPGIIISAKTITQLKKDFKNCLPGYKKACKKYKCRKELIVKVSVV